MAFSVGLHSLMSQRRTNSSSRCRLLVRVSSSHSTHMIGPDAPGMFADGRGRGEAGLTKTQFEEYVAIHPTMAEELVLLK